MSDPSSLFESITDEQKGSTSTLVSRRFNNNNITKFKDTILFRGFKEILFGLFPSIFMPYLDVETFLSLLKTDLWNWHHLLSRRIVFDYCTYISIRHKEQIEQFCQDCNCDSPSYDSSDTVYYDENNEMNNQDHIKYIDFSAEEQNFAILRISCKQTTEINGIFILNVFYDIDVINDRMSLKTDKDIGITTNLCKHITIRKKNVRIRNDINNNNNMHTIFVYDTFNQLQNNLEIKQYYNEEDLMHIKTLLITDILNICVDRWYFVEWRQIKGEYVENNRCVEIIEIKQMIIGHFNSAKYKQNPNHSISKYDENSTFVNFMCMKQELFVAWSIEWQHKQQKIIYDNS